MKRLVFALVALLMCYAGAASAQNRNERGGSERPISLGELTPTPEMWFYEQARRDYENPKNAVRRKAEYQAAQRQHRLAAQRWFGYNNSRPLAGADPMYGLGSPRWTGNGYDAFEWRGIGGTTILYKADNGAAGGLR
jgi:hypothetical protein